MQQNIDDEELRKRIEEAQQKVAAGEIDLRPIGKALFGKLDQGYIAATYIAATLEYARAYLASNLGETEAMQQNTDDQIIPLTIDEALEGIIKAWDSLPKGNYHPRIVESWLINDMAKAIVNAREAIKSRLSISKES